MQKTFEFVIGLLFGLGLLLADMSNPAKVLAFLDLAGAWDPSLAMVMVGAIAVGLIGFTLARRRPQALFGNPMQLPSNTRIDRPLVLGSLCFGVGWGIAGICPGPGLVAAASGESGAIIFLLAMLVGMAIHHWLQTRTSDKP